MTVYTEIFGGNTLYPAEPTFLSLTYSTNQTLVWPIEQAVGGDDIVAKIIELHPSTTGLSVTLPDATLISTGFTAQFYNAASDTTTIKDAGGNTLLTVASGESWTLYLRDNSTTNGLWRSYQAGAGTSSANAASLAGNGLKAIVTTLNTDMPPDAHSSDYVILEADRANPQVWTGGSGNFTLPAPASVGSGWYVPLANQGVGSVTVTPASGTIDLSANLILSVGESTFAVSDGSNYFTIGLGQATNSVFDFISIDVSGTGNYTLSGAQLNRIAYELTGVLTGNRNIIVPASVQQYWINNQTSGAFTLTLKTLAGSGVEVPQGTQRILYCDGTDVVPAESVLLTTPVSVANGGTGLTSGTSGGIPYFSSTSTMASSAALTANQLVIGGGAGTTPTSLGSAGTSTTVLHGNAGGAPTFAAVNLSSEVTGTLAVANGGTGFASGILRAVKTSTTTRTSTATSTADPVLQLALTAGSWDVELLVIFGGTAAPGFRWQIATPGGITGSIGHFANVNGATESTAATGGNTDTTYATLSGGNNEMLRISSQITVASPGTISFAWAQNASNGNPTSVFNGWMLATQIA